MNRGVERVRGLSTTAKVIAGLILAAMALALLVAFFTSDAGRTVALVCCGAVVLLVVVGLLSEQGMRRR